MPEQGSNHELWIVRHAIAEEQDAVRWPDDALRPLSPEGKRRFRVAAKGLKRLGIKPDVVLSSPFIRAMQTADILTVQAGWPAAREAQELTPDADPHAILRVLRGDGAIAVVGHDPHLPALVKLLCGARVAIKKGGVVRITAQSFRVGTATLEWMLPPKAMRAAAAR